MNKSICLKSPLDLYGYLVGMTDDEIADFEINRPEHREMLFDALEAQFSKYGAVGRSRIIDALEYIVVADKCDEYWHCIVPHEVPLDEVFDKRHYTLSLFRRLADRDPDRDFDLGIEAKDVYPPFGME